MAAKKPKPYKEGVRKQITYAWKLRVLDKLAENKTKGVRPANLAQLAKEINADKRGIYVTFDLDQDQNSSAYVDDICRVLGISQPFAETGDDDLESALEYVRKMDPQKRRAWMAALKLGV